MSTSQEGIVVMDFAAGDINSPRLCFADVRFRKHFNCFNLITLNIMAGELMIVFLHSTTSLLIGGI